MIVNDEDEFDKAISEGWFENVPDALEAVNKVAKKQDGKKPATNVGNGWNQ